MVASLADMASIALSVPTAIPPRGILQLIAHKVSLAIVRWKQKIFPEMFRPALGSCPSPPDFHDAQKATDTCTLKCSMRSIHQANARILGFWL